jgi:hypothetical protein
LGGQLAVQEKPSTQGTFALFQEELEAARSKHDFAALRALGDRMEVKLWEQDHRRYFELAARVASSARSDQYDDTQAFIFATRVADTALRRADADLALDTKVDLVMLSQPDLYGPGSPHANLPPDRWLQFRRDQATRWLSLHDDLANAAQGLPSLADTSNWPDSSVSPPSKTRIVFVPGTPASQIADPQSRAEYEASLEANRQKGEKLLLAIKIDRLQTRCDAPMQNFLATLYSFPASNVDELERMMDEHHLSAKERAGIMARLDQLQGHNK